jgi:hypothetical protein
VVHLDTHPMRPYAAVRDPNTPRGPAAYVVVAQTTHDTM